MRESNTEVTSAIERSAKAAETTSVSSSLPLSAPALRQIEPAGKEAAAMPV